MEAKESTGNEERHRSFQKAKIREPKRTKGARLSFSNDKAIEGHCLTLWAVNVSRHPYSLVDVSCHVHTVL
jgi:hypothetical protein